MQAGLSLCWSYIPNCGKFHATAQIYFIECGEKVSIFHERVARKKVNFLFISYWTENTQAQPIFFPGRFSLDLTFSVCLLGIALSVL